MPVLGKRVKRLLSLSAIIAALILIAFRKDWIELYYSKGIFKAIAYIQRILFGWISFSIGDVVYFLLGVGGVYFLFTVFYLLICRKITVRQFFQKWTGLLVFLLTAYLVFQLFWGLNYSRTGIAGQMRLERVRYDSSTVFRLQEMTVESLNKSRIAFAASGEWYPDNARFFDNTVAAYREARTRFPFLNYRIPSVKSSLYSSIFSYLGFSGYYNPFTGEAQVNTSVPKFTIPFITLHEMAHQLGYAKENEANFVGFLVGTNSNDPLIRYSSWLDFFFYVNAEAGFYNIGKAQYAVADLDTLVKKDIEELRQFNRDHHSFMEPASYWMYNNYLRFNDQPQGMKSYNQVVSLVVAYYKKQEIL